MNENPGVRPVRVEDLISIYPNPATRTIYIHGKRELRKPLLVQIYDLHGRMLKEETSFRNDFSVDISRLIAGTYILKLYNGNDMEVQIEKFIKQ